MVDSHFQIAHSGFHPKDWATLAMTESVCKVYPEGNRLKSSKQGSELHCCHFWFSNRPPQAHLMLGPVLCLISKLHGMTFQWLSYCFFRPLYLDSSCCFHTWHFFCLMFAIESLHANIHTHTHTHTGQQPHRHFHIFPCELRTVSIHWLN